jgi:hypothetical protein
MKDIDRLKAALGIDSSIIGATVLYNEINKVQNRCGNLLTQEEL